jgi:molybdopterin converting factor small subunit
MKITVRHFATLKKDLRPGPQAVELTPGATVDDLLAKLGIEKEAVGILIVSGKSAIFGQELKANDVVTLIPHIGGG